MRKIAVFLLSLLLLFSFTSCGIHNIPDIENPTSSQDNQAEASNNNSNSENANMEEISVSLISVRTNKFDNMQFADYTKSQVSPSEDGTAFTLIVHSNHADLNINQIETITIKTADNKTVNMNTRAYMFNNKKAYVVFAKTEGIHKPEEYAVSVKTYDGNERLIPVQNAESAEIMESILTPAGDAKYGDIIKMKGEYYFVLQNGKLSNTSYTADNITISEVVIGVVFVPLTNSFTQGIKNEDFTTEFFDNEELGTYGVETTLKINDTELKEQYADNYKGLFTELITVTFRLESEETDVENVNAKRDYVVDNTWLKGNFEENFLFKVYPRP